MYYCALQVLKTLYSFVFSNWSWWMARRPSQSGQTQPSLSTQGSFSSPLSIHKHTWTAPRSRSWQRWGHSLSGKTFLPLVRHKRFTYFSISLQRTWDQRSSCLIQFQRNRDSSHPQVFVLWAQPLQRSSWRRGHNTQLSTSGEFYVNLRSAHHNEVELKLLGSCLH